MAGRAEEDARRVREPAAALELRLVTHAADHRQQGDGFEIENRLGLRVVAGLHAVTRQAQDRRHAHRGGADHVSLDRDPVPVPAGHLHDDGVVRAPEERTDRDARHVAVRARTVRSIDRIDGAVEDAGRPKYLFGIGGIRRRQFGGHHELPGPEQFLEAPGR